jgi:hypothetical protein
MESASTVPMYALFLLRFNPTVTKLSALVILCFVAGYLIVNQVWTGLTTSKPKALSDDHCRRVLGLGNEMDSQLIHEAYQARLRKYDPSKFVEYGPEFQELARERTNAIIAAYQHLTASINR